MRITREKHPLQGKSLSVLGRMHRNGTLNLILTLPDGGSSLIPAVWTDFSGVSAKQSQNNPHTSHIACLGDLMHARTVVDALLGRMNSTTHTCPPTKEDSHATGAILHTPPRAHESTSMGKPDRGAPSSGGCSARPTHEQSGSKPTKERK